MKNILLPTDFSENALNAIKYALKLLKDERCVFYLLNTYTPIIYNYDFQMQSGGYLGDVVDIIRDNSEENLDNLKEKLIDKYASKTHEFETISSFNQLTDEIKDVVKSKEIDLIVMGTKGASGVKEVLFGTNTIHTIQKVKCPILAIPDGYYFETPTDILFPTDYKIDYSKKQLITLKTIAKNFNTNIHILNVSHGRELNKEELNNKATLRNHLTKEKHIFHRVGDTDIPVAITNFQKNTYVQLLMMINNKRSFFENLFFRKTINQIGFHLTIPFLVIPSKIKNKS